MKTIDYKVPNGKMLKIKVDIDGKSIKSIAILGDFFLHPESTIDLIEKSLIRSEINIEDLSEKIQRVLEDTQSVLIGATADDIAKAIEKATLE